MTIEKLEKEILKAIKINKNCIPDNFGIDDKNINLIKSDFDDLKKFVIKLFKEYRKGE